MRETAKKTVLAALLAWLLTRVLRRLLGVALIAAVLAGAVTVASRNGVDVDGARRVVQCEARAIVRAAKQLRDAGSSDSPAGAQRQRRALRGIGRCDRQTARSSAQRGGPKP